MKRIVTLIILFAPFVGQQVLAQDSQGGGVYAKDAKVTSSVITGNQAVGQGTGVYAGSGAALVNNTVADNKQGSTGLQAGTTMDGGVVFFVDQAARKGLIVSLTEAPATVKYSYKTWGELGQNITGASDMNNGKANQAAIIAAQVIVPDINGCRDNPLPKPGDCKENLQPADTARRATHWCKEYKEGGRTDWFLPSREQLKKLYVAKEAVNATLSTTQGATVLGSDYYWSSTQADAYAAWYVYFDNGEANISAKSNVAKVRAIREFTF